MPSPKRRAVGRTPSKLQRIRRQFAIELLETRYLLAGDTTLWIDFSASEGGQTPPGAIPASFANLFAAASWTSSSAQAKQFLDMGGLVDGVARPFGDTDGDGTWDGDGTLDQADVQIAQAKIVQTVESLFQGYSLSVKSTTSGWDILQQSQNNSNANSFVLFVGDEFLQSGIIRTFGRSFQAPVGENNEWFGFAYAGNIAKKMVDGDLLANKSPQDFVWNVSSTIAREFGRMLGLGKPGVYDGTNFIAAGQGSAAAVTDPLSSLMAAGGKTRGSTFSSIDYATLPALPVDIDVEQFTRNGGTISRSFAAGQNQNAELLASLTTDTTVYQARGLITGFGGESNDEVTADLLRQSFASPAYSVPAASLGTKGTSTPTTIAQDFVDGFNTYASTYVDDIANQLNFAATTLPLVNANLSQALGLASSLPALLPTLSASGVTSISQLRSYLISNGFAIDQSMSDTAFNNLASNSAGDFLRAHRSFTLLDIAGQLGMRSGGLSGIQYLQSLGFTGNVEVLASIGFHIAVGIDTAGFYLVPGLIIEANAAAAGSAYASVNAALAAAGSFDANLMTSVTLKTNAADGRIRLQNLASNLATYTETNLSGRAGLDVSYQANVAGDALIVDGGWNWNLDEAGATLENATSSLNGRSLKQSITELVYAGLQKLSNNASTLSSKIGDIPWIGGSVSSNIAQSLSAVFSVDTASISMLDALSAKGFNINLTITPEQFLDALQNGSPLPSELLTINYVTTITQPLSGSATGSSNLAGMNLGLSGSVAGSTSNTIELNLGFSSTSGAYLAEGATITSSITTNGNITGTATVPGLTQVTATGALSVSGLSAALTLTDGDASAGEKFYLDSNEGLSDALKTSIAWNGNVALNNLKVKATLPNFVGVSLPQLEVTVAANYNMNSGLGSFTSTQAAMLDGLAQWVFAGISSLRTNVDSAANAIQDIPLVGNGIASNIRTAMKSGLNFTVPASGVTAYLASRGFTVSSIVTAQQLFSGSLGANPLLELTYSRSIQPAQFTSDFSGDLKFGPVALSLDGQATIAATLQYQATFGLDLSNGPYLLEGAGITATVPLVVNMTGFASVGSLVRVAATADLNTSVIATSRFSDFDATPSERFYLINNPTQDSFSISSIFADPQSRQLTGSMHLNLALIASNPAAKFPVIGQYLPTNFQWNAVVDYNLATQQGNYEIVQDATFQSAVNLLTNTRQELMNSMLVELDRRNPMPQSLRDLLTKPLPVIGISPADIVGLPEEAKIVLNPLAYQNRTPEQLESGTPNADHVDVRFDAATVSNVVKLLSGQDADLVSLDIQQTFTVDKTIPVVAAPLFSLFGVVNFDIAVNIIAEIGLAFNLVVGFDTKGFYIEESASDNDYVVSFIGSIGGQLVGTGRLVILPFAEVSAALSLIATGGVLLNSNDGDAKLRISEITDPDNISLGLSIGLGLDIDSTLGFPDLNLSTSFQVFQRTFELYQANGSAANIQDALSGVGDKILEEGKKLALKAALGPILILQEVGQAVVNAIEDTAAVVGEFATETTRQIQEGLSNAADAASDYLDHAAGVVSGLVNDANEALKDLGEAVLTGIGIDDPGSIFGTGKEHPVTPPQRRTFSYTVASGVLTVTANPNHGFATDAAAKLTAAIAPDGRLVIDGPDFVRVETVGYTESGCFDGCERDDIDEDYTHFNRLIIGLVGITRIEIKGTQFDDSIIVDRSVATTVYLYGMDGNDLLIGGRGNDNLFGGAGADNLFGNDGNDTVDGQEDDDIISGGQGRDTLVGGSGNDSLDESQDTSATTSYFYGDGGDDVIRGSDAVNFAYGGDGNDLIFGGLNNDRLFGEGGDDYLEGRAGSDSISGGDGLDKLVGDDPAGNLTGDDTLRGGSGDDKLSGGKGNDSLYGDDGADNLLAGDGNDLLVGGSSTISESVGDGNDMLNAGNGSDTVYGGRGDDLLSGGSENDSLYGGSGNDTIDGGSGSNKLYGDAGNDNLNGLGGSDVLYGGDGNDLIIGKDVYAGAGNDTVIGSGGIDRLRGEAGDDKINGLDGDDQIFGGDGQDTISGGQGNDRLSGEGGNDTYVFISSANLGSDVLMDSAGIDTINFDTSKLNVSLSLASRSLQLVNSALQLTLSNGNFENITGGDGRDQLTGNSLNNILRGGPGDDTYYFNTSTKLGFDQVIDTDGIDTINFDGSSLGVTFDLSLTSAQTVNANHTLKLGSGSSIENIIGTAKNDTLSGNALANQFIGGLGDDALNGRNGNDVYVFSATSSLGRDTVTDTQGVDTLDFRGSKAGIVIDLGLTSAQAINSLLQLTLATQNSIENVIATSFDDTITANPLSNRLEGLEGDDRYIIKATGSVGNDVIVDKSGNDTLDYSLSTDPLQINLASISAQTVTATHKLQITDAGLIENVFGGSNDDSLSGNTSNNVLSGGGGNDTLRGAAGDDVYLFDTDGQLGSDRIEETTGVDTLDFSSSKTGNKVSLITTAEQVVNSNLRLTLSSASVIERLIGGDGNDTLTGNTLNNLLRGNAGDDLYLMPMSTPRGSDRIEDSAGVDTLDFSDSTLDVTIDLSLVSSQQVSPNLTLTLATGDSIDNVLTGSGSDKLTGNSLDNRFTGGAGNDFYYFAANSKLGFDFISDVAGLDTIDFSQSTAGVTFSLASTQSQSTNIFHGLQLESDASIEVLRGGSGSDFLTGNSLSNSLAGGDGNDTYYFTAHLPLGTDSLIDSSGNDTLNFITTTVPIVLDLASTAQQQITNSLQLTLVNFESIENAIGGQGSDRIVGNSKENFLSGSGGLDTLIGASGNDNLQGGADADDLSGDGDNDSLSGDDGPDILRGSVGNDVLVGGNGDDRLFGDAGNDRLEAGDGADELYGDAGNDTLLAGTGADELYGHTGNDQLDGGEDDDVYYFPATVNLGSDVITETSGIDTVDLTGTPIDATLNLGIVTPQVVNARLTLKLNGDADIDNVIGGSASDTFTGNRLDNILEGAGGSDTLRGREGSDTYLFRTAVGTEADAIEEIPSSLLAFNQRPVDVIDFSSLAANDPVQVDLTKANDVFVQHRGRTIRSTSLLYRVDIEEARGGLGADTFTARADWFEPITLLGNNGNDRFNLSWNIGGETIVAKGGTGDDTVALTGANVNDYFFSDVEAYDMSGLEFGDFNAADDARSGTVVGAPFTVTSPNGVVVSQIAGWNTERSLSNNGDTDTYNFRLTKPTRLWLDIRAIAMNDSLNWTLIGPNGSEVDSGSFGSEQDVLLPVLPIGDYQFIVDGTNRFAGSYDYRLYDVDAVATTISYEQIVDITRTPGNGTQFYKFTGQAGDLIFIDKILEETESFSPNWTLLDPFGSVVIGSPIYFDIPRTELKNTGTYTLVIQGDNSHASPQDLKFRINRLSETVEGMQLNAPVSSTLAKPGQVDRYSFTVTQPTQLFFDARSPDDELRWDLNRSNGESVVNSLRSDDRFLGTLQPDTYTISVSRMDDSIGPYSFALLDFLNATTIGLNTNQSFTTSVDSGAKLYQFAATANSTVYIDLLTGQNASRLSWQLFDPFGKNLADTPLFLTIGRVDLEFAGNYTLAISSEQHESNSLTGSFRIHSVTDQISTLTLGNPVSTTISKVGEHDVYSFRLDQPTRLRINLTIPENSVGNPAGTLEGPGGTVLNQIFLSSDNDTGLVAAGDYKVTIADQSNKTFSYQLVVKDIGVPSPGNEATTPGTLISVGTEAGGNLAPLRRYKFTLSSPTMLAFDARQSASKFSFEIESPSGNIISSFAFANNSSPLGLFAAGTYQLRIQSSVTDPFRFALLDLSSAQTVALDTVTTTGLPRTTEAKIYRFNGNAGDVLYFDTLSATTVSSVFDIDFSLIDPNGKIVESTNAQRDLGRIVLSESGNYYVIVSGTSDDPLGASSIKWKIVPVTDTVQNLTFNSLFSPSLSQGQLATYEFTLTAPKLLRLDNRTAEGQWELTGPGGFSASSMFLFGDQNVGWLQAGKYRLVLRNDSGDPVTIPFMMQDLAAATALNLEQTYNVALAEKQSVLYRFNATAGQSFFVNELGDNQLADFDLIDPLGHEMNSIVRDDRFTASTTGTYTLVVKSYLDDAQNVSFKVSSIADGSKTAAFNVVQTQTIAKPGQKREYVFNLAQPAMVYLDILSNTVDNLSWSLESSDSRLNSSLLFLFDDQLLGYLPAGPQKFIVSSPNDNIGTFSFALRTLDSASTLSIDTPTPITISKTDSTKLFKFDGGALQSVFVSFNVTGETSRVQWKIYDPLGKLLHTSNTDGSRRVDLPVAGSYTLVVTGDVGLDTTVSGTVLVTSVIDVVIPATFNNTLTGSIPRTQAVHNYVFKLEQPTPVWLDSLTTTNGNVTWTLTGAGQNESSVLEFGDRYLGVLAAGEYSFSLTSSSSEIAEYRFRLLDAATALPMSIGNATTPTGQLLTVNFTDPNSSKIYTFNANSGDVMNFLDRSVAGSEGFTSFTLVSPLGHALRSNTSWNTNGIVMPQTGTYTLYVQCGTSGDPNTATTKRFRIDYARSTTGFALSGTTAVLDQIINASVPATSSRKFQFMLSNPMTMAIDLLSESSSSDWQVYSADGMLVWSSSSLSNELVGKLDAGTYQLSIAGQGSAETVRFRLTTATTDLALNTTTIATLSPTTALKLYRFQGQAHANMHFNSIEAPNGSFDALWSIYDPYGNRMFDGTFIANDRFTLPYSGDYVLMVYGTTNTTGSTRSTFSLQEVDRSAAPVFQGISATQAYNTTTRSANLFSDGRLTDRDNHDFNGARIDAQITQNALATDRLRIASSNSSSAWSVSVAINNAATQSGQVFVVMPVMGVLQKVYAGDVYGGIGNTNLRIELNANANLAAVQAILKSLQYWSSSANAGTNERTVAIEMTDGRGATSARSNVRITF